jgi:HD-like signal output (HDOD) protein
MPERVVAAEPVVQSSPAAGPNLAVDSVTIPVKLCNLPPLSSIALQVMSLSADENMDLQRLASVIEADPAFAAEVLFLANSSLFGFPSRMQVLRHAVAVLGLDRIQALAVTVAMRAFVGQTSPLVHQCWRHSSACAIIAEETSPLFGVSGDRAYTLALMHDIGRLGLLKSYAREIGPVLSATYENTNAVLAAERAAVNVDHGLAGAWLVKTWSFPREFSEICEHHHAPLQAKESDLLRLMKISCLTADTLGYAAVGCANIPSFSELLTALPADTRLRFPEEGSLRKNVEARLSAFEK